MDIRGLTRRNYWDFPLINPLLMPGITPFAIDAFVSDEFSADCHRLFLEGYPDVIFEYAHSEPQAFRAPWVVAQLEQWQRDNTPESRAQGQRLMHAYYTTQGSRSIETTVQVIARDQQIFKATINIKRQHPQMRLDDYKDTQDKRLGKQPGIYSVLATEHHMSRNSVEAIYKLYKAKTDAVMGTIPARLLSPHLLSTTQYDALQGALHLLGQDQPLDMPETPLLPTWANVFHWLDDMRERLQWLEGIDTPRV